MLYIDIINLVSYKVISFFGKKKVYKITVKIEGHYYYFLSRNGRAKIVFAWCKHSEDCCTHHLPDIHASSDQLANAIIDEYEPDPNKIYP